MYFYIYMPHYKPNCIEEVIPSSRNSPKLRGEEEIHDFKMTIFGQVVVGPPGAGKSTYCLGMQMFCQEIGRKAAIINLDFANDALPYKATIDVRQFLTLQV